MNRDAWIAWFEAVGDPPAPLEFQSSQEGFVCKPINASGPLVGNCVPYAPATEERALTSRNVTSLHWPGIFCAREGRRGTCSISLDSGVEVSNFLARLGRTFCIPERGLLAPIQINRNLPPGTIDRGKGVCLPRCDLDFKIRVPYEDAAALVNNDPEQCLLDMQRMRSYHFSPDQVRHHCRVIGAAVARVFRVPADQIVAVVMRSPLPAMELVRVRHKDGSILFAPRRSTMHTDEHGWVRLTGDVTIKPSYWMIFHLRDQFVEPPSRVYTESSADGIFDPQQINVARLFRMDEVSERESPDPLCNYQHPGLRMQNSKRAELLREVSKDISADYNSKHREMWTIHGHVVQGLPGDCSAFLDDPSGQRLCRAPKTHPCPYHTLYDTCTAAQVRCPVPHESCPFEAMPHVCLRRPRDAIVPVPAVRFVPSTSQVLPSDRGLLRTKSMTVEFVVGCKDGEDIPHAMELLRVPGWGPVLEQAWTCPYVTARVARTSKDRRGVGVHVGKEFSMHNGRQVLTPVHRKRRRGHNAQRRTTCCPAWATGRASASGEDRSPAWINESEIEGITEPEHEQWQHPK